MCDNNNKDASFIDDEPEGGYYAKQFYIALREHSVKDNKLSPYKQWEYIGGDTGSHYLKLSSNMEPLPKEYECICTHDIIENCYIQNIITGEILIVGNCCIKKYLKIDTSKKCQKCDKPHKNRKDNFCNTCRLINKEAKTIKIKPPQILTIGINKEANTIKIKPPQILTIGKHKGNSFQYILDNDQSYCKWVLDKNPDYISEINKMKDFILYLRENL